MLWVRGVSDRLEKLAPFLSYDTDPYPVAVERPGRVGGRRLHHDHPLPVRPADRRRATQAALRPAATTTTTSATASRPSSTPTPVRSRSTWSTIRIRSSRRGGVRSRTCSPRSTRCPRSYASTCGIPEDLFRIQTDMYSKYRIDPSLFFQRDGNAWSVSQAPSPTPTSSNGEVVTPASADDTVTAAQQTFATESDALRFSPYYTVFNTSLPEEPRKNEFVLLRPFVPFSTNDERTELQAYMTASSDPETYGKLTTYVVEMRDGRLPDGPLRVASNAESTEAISRRISLDNVGGGGSQVRFGDLQIVPVAGGLIYVRPYYVSVPQSSGSSSTVTEFRSVIVSYNDRAVLEPTIAQASGAAVPGLPGRDRRPDRHPSRTAPAAQDRDPPADDASTDRHAGHRHLGWLARCGAVARRGRRPLRRGRRGTRRGRPRHVPVEDRRGPGQAHRGPGAPRRTERHPPGRGRSAWTRPAAQVCGRHDDAQHVKMSALKLERQICGRHNDGRKAECLPQTPWWPRTDRGRNRPVARAGRACERAATSRGRAGYEPGRRRRSASSARSWRNWIW